MCKHLTGVKQAIGIGLVAEQHLTQKTKAAVDDLLQGESLAFVSTYGDEIRSNKEFKHFDPWHYVNMPLDKRYGDETPNPKGDVYHASTVWGCLKTTKQDREDKAFYLRLLVHFVGDLHQPMHVGRSGRSRRKQHQSTLVWKKQQPSSRVG